MNKVVEEYASIGLIHCACGCGTLIKEYDKKGKKRSFVKFHHWRGRKHNEESKVKIGNYNRKNKIVFGELRKKNHFNGYVWVYQPEHKFADCRGYVMEHRLIWEEHNKACLLPWADVHHKNKIRNDNHPKNLEGMTHIQHSYVTIRGNSCRQ